jgi:hypothetical protein
MSFMVANHYSITFRRSKGCTYIYLALILMVVIVSAQCNVLMIHLQTRFIFESYASIPSLLHVIVDIGEGRSKALRGQAKRANEHPYKTATPRNPFILVLV